MTTDRIKIFEFAVSRRIRGSADEMDRVRLDPTSPGGL